MEESIRRTRHALRRATPPFTARRLRRVHCRWIIDPIDPELPARGPAGETLIAPEIDGQIVTPSPPPRARTSLVGQPEWAAPTGCFRF